MTDQQHPLTPPPELTAKFWREATAGRDDAPFGEIFNYGIQLAYAAGADQELDACCEYIYERLKLTTIACISQELRAARRPKPPSLAEEALKALGEALFMADDVPPEGICSDQADTIRRALERLQQLEEQQ